jgi:hypothetical protein
MLKCEDVRLLKLDPNVVVGSGLIIGVGVIVIYGGDCAFAIPTHPSADIIEIILEICFFKSSINFTPNYPRYRRKPTCSPHAKVAQL